MKPNDRAQIVALGIFAAFIVALGLSGQYASAAATAQSPQGDCTVAFSGNLTSLQMTPAGSWKLTSTSCSVGSQSNGITSGTFTGSFTSSSVSGIVTGTWSTTGGAQSVVASSTGFTLSVSADQGVGKAPILGSAYQGMLSGTGIQAMLVTGTGGALTSN